MGATPTQSATLRPCTIRGPCPDTRESVELRRLGDLKGANPNRISSSGHGCPDRQRLDQRPWLVLAERHCTMVNCNPNCNLAHDSWAQLVAVFKIASATTPPAALTCTFDHLLIRQTHGHPAHIPRARVLDDGDVIPCLQSPAKESRTVPGLVRSASRI